MDHAFLRFPGFKDKALTLSYDDGVVQDERLIEIMTRYGLKGTFNLNSELFADRPQGRRLTKEQALALYIPSGNEVAVHAPGICLWPKRTAAWELTRSSPIGKTSRPCSAVS